MPKTASSRRVLLSVLALAVLLPGCWTLTPRLDPADPPVNVPDGMLLVKVPAEDIELQHRPEVEARMLAWTREEPTPEPWRQQAARESRLVTGMTTDEVIFAMRSHPTRVDEQGPPAGRTWMWGRCRYWARFDIQGRLVAAGRY